MYKKILNKHITIFLLILFASSCTVFSAGIKPIKTPEADSLKNNVEELTDNFFSFLTKNSFTVPYRPEIIVVNKIDSRFIPYKKKGKLITPLWDELDKIIQDDFNESTKNSKFNGKSFFETYFNWFLPIHELGHFIQYIKKDSSNYYNREIEANEIAIVYFRETGDTIKLNKLLNFISTAKNNMTIPKDISEEYFNNNYYDILKNHPDEYGYFQFMFMEIAFKTEKQFVNEFLK